MIATVSVIVLGLGFALCVLAAARVVVTLVWRHRLNPFDLTHARAVLGGRYANATRPPFLSTAQGLLAMAFIGVGVLGLLVALFLWALARGG